MSQQDLGMSPQRENFDGIIEFSDDTAEWLNALLANSMDGLSDNNNATTTTETPNIEAPNSNNEKYGVNEFAKILGVDMEPQSVSIVLPTLMVLFHINKPDHELKLILIKASEMVGSNGKRILMFFCKLHTNPTRINIHVRAQYEEYLRNLAIRENNPTGRHIELKEDFGLYMWGTLRFWAGLINEDVKGVRILLKDQIGTILSKKERFLPLLPNIRLIPSQEFEGVRKSYPLIPITT